MKFLLIFCSYIAATVFACNSTTSTAEQSVVASTAVVAPPSYEFKYKVNQPSKTRELPKILTEISGLALDSLGNLFAIQDENGIIFQLDKDEIKKYKFKGDGDYEGIEIVGDKVYVVKNTGTVYEVHDLGSPKQTRMDYNDFLTSDYDVEGLGYDATSNALLIACKADGNRDGNKAIYTFDLTTKKVSPQPYFNINIADYRDVVFQYALETKGKKFQKMIKKKGKDNLFFYPSGIAVHPMTNDIYILSAKGRMLMICNRKGEILHLEALDKDIHKQAEGIAFGKDGTLYIANEGKKKAGLVHTFNYVK